MDAMLCRASSTIPCLIASNSGLSSSKMSRSQCALLGGPHSPQSLHLVMLPQVDAKWNMRRNVIVFSKDDAHMEAVEDLAILESATQTLPDISQSRSEFQTASIPSWIAVAFGAAVLFSTAFLPSVSLGPLGFLREGLYIVGSPQLWQSVLYTGAFIHVLEAAFAYYLARRVDPQNEVLWFWQTLFLGFFSLSSLLQKFKEKENLKHNL